MKFILKQYKRAFSHLRESWLFIVIVTVLLVLSVCVGYLLAVLFPELFKKLVQIIQETLFGGGFVDEEGNISTIMLFFNNARAAILGIGQGFIPFLFIPTLSVLLNGAVIGVILGMYGANGGNVLLIFASGILPHGIFELTALIISWSSGLYLCYSMIRLILGKVSGDGFVEVLKRLAAAYCCLVIPLLVIAAAVEANLTPIIMEAVL